MRESLRLQPAGKDDDEFLLRVFCADRAPEFAPLGLSAPQLGELLRSQFDSRERQYRERFPTADFDLILHNAHPVGNCFAQRGPDEFVLIDITLLPEHRNQGIGTALVNDLIEAARAVRKPLHAHVLQGSPAWHLWQRLGFCEVSNDGIYRQIEVPSGPR